MDPDGVNQFCSSQLWREQLVQTKCRALDEAEFIVPASGFPVSSAEGRRNYTDVQETAQWLGGTEIPTAILVPLMACVSSDFDDYFVFFVFFVIYLVCHVMF